jgi:hypothetical protein
MLLRPKEIWVGAPGSGVEVLFALSRCEIGGQGRRSANVQSENDFRARRWRKR